MTALQTRSAVLEAPRQIRTKRAVVTTQRPVEVYDHSSRSIVREVLVLSGMTAPASVPLLVDHDRSVRATAGTATNFRVVGDTVEADLSFATGTSAADEAWQLADQGHLRTVSVGYRVTESRNIPAGRSETIDGLEYRGPVRVATKWSLYEVSLVPVPADQAATLFRSFTRKESPMPATLTSPRSDVSHLRLLDYCRAFVKGQNGRVDGSDSDLVREFGHVGGLTDLDNKFQTWLLNGYNNASDSLAGIVAEVPLPNYLTSQLAAVGTPAAPLRIGRGQQAPSLQLAVSFESWRLFKTGITFELSEEDIIDSADTLDVLALAVREVGAGFRRVVLDALWGCLLSNPTLADGTALFATARGNLGTAALGTTSLGTAYAAIAGQVRAIAEDASVFAHDNLRPTYLVVPAEMAIAANTVVDAASISGAPLVNIRVESRLGSNGFLSPQDDTVRSGNSKNWLVACSAAEAPALVLGLLNGRREPRFQGYELRNGQWGRGFNADLSIGVQAVDGRPVYWSTGAA
ncbi:MAG: phage major capsid protein [Pirellulaceae bacterium]